ncbi:TonB-dependent receptor [Dasania marina]|uniref:TonB-dependent receptor n=1 Tax=Dasania marina TaxID=471499 RepID=UPI0030DCD962
MTPSEIISLKNSYKKRALSTSIALLAASLAATSASAAQLEEVFVTASKRTESVQDIPYNISAITGSDLEDKGISDLTKLARTIPGLAYSDKGARGGLVSSGLVIRGINAEDSRSYLPNSNVPVISTYINETPIFTNIRLTDIERVEVLRGPQGTLYGSGALGGTLRYIQREPNPDQFEAKISGEISQVAEGDDLGWKTDVMLNVPITDNMAVRINLGKEEQAGFIDQTKMYQVDSNGAPVLADPSKPVTSPGLFTSKDDVNDAEIENARIHFMIQTDKAIINIAHHYQKTQAGGSQMGLASGDEFSSAALLEESYEGESNLTSLDVEYDLGFASLTANFSTYDSDNTGFSDQTSLYQEFSFYADYYGSSPRSFFVDKSIWEEEADIAEIRLSSESEGSVDWAVGFFHMDQDAIIGIEDSYLGYTDYSNACFTATPGSLDTDGVPVGGEPCGLGTLFGVFPSNGPISLTEQNKDLTYVSLAENNFKDQAIFGEATWHITDEWQTTLGFRRFDQEYTSNAVAGLVFVPGAVFGAESVFKEKDTLFKFNSSYDISDNKMAFITISEGFRRGGANALGGAAPVAVHTYGSDFTTNYEIGLKGNIDNYYQYTVSAFFVDWQDIQLNTSCGDLVLNCVINAGDAESKGIEAQIEGNVSDNLSVGASYTYADAELTSIGSQTSYTTTEIAEGNQLPQSPKHSASWSATYTQMLSNGIDVAYFLGATYRGETETSINANSIRTKAFTLWDAHVAVNTEQWSVRLFVDNIANEIGVTGEENVLDWGSSARVNISRPRTVGVSGYYNF